MFARRDNHGLGVVLTGEHRSSCPVAIARRRSLVRALPFGVGRIGTGRFLSIRGGAFAIVRITPGKVE